MLRYLLEKEFKQFFRNTFLPKMVIIMPAMVMLVFPLIANFEIKNINLSVVDNDRSTYSTRLVHKIQASGYYRITSIPTTYNEALIAVERDKADVILEIPVGFERELVRDHSSKVMITSNAVNGVKGGLGSAYLANIVNDFSSSIRTEWLPNTSRFSVPRFEIHPRFWFNPTLQYHVFMIPALMVMVLAIVCGFLPALNIVSEKENGTMEQMNVTPVNKFLFIISKLIPFWIVGFVVLSICFLVARWVYGLVPVGSLLTIYLFSSIFVLAFSGFGLVISNYAKTLQQAMFMMFFFVLTFIFMSGLYTPVDNMPEWAQYISHFSPLKYIIKVLRLVYLKGSGFSELIPSFLALSGFAVFFNSWAVISYRKSS